MKTIEEVLALISAWAPIIQGVEQKGVEVYNAIKKTLEDHGVEVDTAKLDEIIADAEARRRRAEEEANRQ